MRYASIGLMEYFDDVGFSLEQAIAENVYPNLCDAKAVQRPSKTASPTAAAAAPAAEASIPGRRKTPAKYDFRKQAPYFEGVREWNLPR